MDAKTPDIDLSTAEAEPLGSDVSELSPAQLIQEMRERNRWAEPYWDELLEWAKGPPIDPPESFREARKAACLSRAGFVATEQLPNVDLPCFAQDRSDTILDTWDAWAEPLLKLHLAIRETEDKAAQRLAAAVLDCDLSAIAINGADFSRFVFPGDADFSDAQFRGGEANFYWAQFHGGDANFSDAQFRGGEADFRGAQFHGGRADFRGAQFHGGEADFRGAQFHGGEANFYWAQFHGGEANFRGAQFHGGGADFSAAQFHGGRAYFFVAQFHGGGAYFSAAQFRGGEANFSHAQFHGGDANFSDAQFHGGEADFSAAQFHGGYAYFSGAQFHFGTQFHDSAANFSGAQFGKAEGASGLRADFSKIKVAHRSGGTIRFDQCQINSPITFNGAEIDRASFRSIHSKVSFSLANTTFKRVPDFIEAAFHATPRVDNVTVTQPTGKRYARSPDGPRDPRPLIMRIFPRWHVAADTDEETRFRVLRKLAIDAHDHNGELEFYAQEVRCRRFWRDKPFGKRAGHFWLGIIYEKISNFGRSALRPLMVWAALIAFFALLYAWQTPGAISPRVQAAKAPAASLFTCPDGPDANALAVHACRGADTTLRTAIAGATSLSRAVAAPFHNAACTDGRADTSVPREAFALSLKNAFVFIDWDRAEAARRTFGCLYGLKFEGTNSHPIVPYWVSILSMIQNVLSAVLIFLFLLAIRNALKLK